MNPHEPSPRPSCHSDFATTRWSVVIAAGEQDDPVSREALATLCQAYWYPVYAYVRRRIGDVDAAQDLTQTFFARLLEKQTLRAADPGRGRFRAFLLTACKRFLINEWHKGRAAKRGGEAGPLSLDFQVGESRFSLEPVETLTAERLYERQWAITLLARALDQLKEECAARGKAAHFEQLKPFLSGARCKSAWATAAAALGMSDGAVKVAAHRLRARYREILRGEIAQTVDRPEDVDEEIRNLFTVLGG
jgi:RNA polymerase sigma-70 factor (ECF subfamily)